MSQLQSVAFERLSQVAECLGGELAGEDVPFSGVSIDSRTLTSGALFFALQGPNFDGSRFLHQAKAAGAVAAVVQQQQEASALPQIIVEESRVALGQFAAAWRAQFEIPLLALTGSNGKTTLKEMVTAILQCSGRGTMTEGNLNNEIGVPLTLLQISAEDRWAVVEMGARAIGDIALLCTMAQPTIALVNNIGSAHLGEFGSIAHTVEAKGEVYSGLRADGIALIHQDQPHASRWHELARGRHVETYGACSEERDPPLMVCSAGESQIEQSPLLLRHQRQQISVQLPLLGDHNRINALAAAALALQAGATLEEVKQGLESVRPVAGRLEPKAGRSGSTVIDDSYNANPESMKSGIRVLSSFTGLRVLVVGSMGELGSDAPRLHREIGAFAHAEGVDRLFAVGRYGGDVVAGFGEGGAVFESIEPLLDQLERLLQRQPTILVKGSRAMRMERVVHHLVERTAR